MKRLIVLAALLLSVPTMTGCCSGYVRADAIAKTVSRVTYRYEELVKKKVAEKPPGPKVFLPRTCQ